MGFYLNLASSDLSGWYLSAYLSQIPSYRGPPSHEQIKELFQKFGVKMEDLAKRFGSMTVEPIYIDEQIQNGDAIGSLKVIHTLDTHPWTHLALFGEA